MKFKLILICATIAVFASITYGSFTAATGYDSTVLVDTIGTYTVAEGMAIDGQNLYYGNYNSVKNYDLSNGTTVTEGSIQSNAGISYVARNNDVTYLSYGQNYNYPYPYNAGYIDNGSFVSHLTMDGIFDIAIYSDQAYIVSNPGVNGSEIYNYDLSSGNVAKVATIGGSSGAITFDSLGNLYYADQGIIEYDPVTYQATVVRASKGIVKFNAAQLAAGNLTIDDAASVVDLVASYICTDDNGDIIATSGYATSTVALYDTSTGQKLNDFGYGSGALGKVLWQNETLYVIETDYNDYASTINAVTVPEPFTVIILGLGAIGLVRRKR